MSNFCVKSIQQSMGYMRQLDGLRVLAVLAVLYTHYLLEQYWLLGQYWGGFGVQLFFIISGFLIIKIILIARDEAVLYNFARISVLKQFYIRPLSEDFSFILLDFIILLSI